MFAHAGWTPGIGWGAQLDPKVYLVHLYVQGQASARVIDAAAVILSDLSSPNRHQKRRDIHEVWCESPRGRGSPGAPTHGAHQATSLCCLDPNVLTDLGQAGQSFCKIEQEFLEGGESGHFPLSSHPEVETLDEGNVGPCYMYRYPLLCKVIPFLGRLLALGNLSPLLFLTKCKMQLFLLALIKKNPLVWHEEKIPVFWSCNDSDLSLLPSCH